MLQTLVTNFDTHSSLKLIKLVIIYVLYINNKTMQYILKLDNTLFNNSDNFRLVTSIDHYSLGFLLHFFVVGREAKEN